MQSEIVDGTDFQERRGTQYNHLEVMMFELKRIHLQWIPSELSHYCAHKIDLKYVKNPELCVKIQFITDNIYTKYIQ